MQVLNTQNHRYTGAHQIVHTFKNHLTANPAAVAHGIQKLQRLQSLCNPLVTSRSGKTVAGVFAEHTKELGA